MLMRDTGGGRDGDRPAARSGALAEES